MVTYYSCQYSVPPEYIGKILSLQVYDNYLHVYYNTTMVAMHAISSKKLNYLEQHYIAISRLTLKSRNCDINAVARQNLKQIYFIILTTNINFNSWDDVFYDPVIANAILDRILHHAHVVNITGRSYRLKEYMTQDEE